MNNQIAAKIKSPYLIFIGDADEPVYLKTGLGIMQWTPELVAGQLRFAGNNYDLGVPDMTLEQAVDAGVKSIIIGVAPVGGNISTQWVDVLVKAATLGLDVVSGLHVRLEHFPDLDSAANSTNSKLINIRTPPNNLPIGNGLKRKGRRLLMVGTDCAVGKKYSALALTKSLQKNSFNATFRATGQTGIMIAGTGIPIDAVISDFVAGAAEVISPDAEDPNHWDIIEGQGSLFHPSYAGVSLGLLHGSQPDAIIVCHDATRLHIDTIPDQRIPSIAECIDLNIRCGQITNPEIICVGVCVNTSGLAKSERDSYLEKQSSNLGLPCVDPILDGCEKIITKIRETF